MLHNHLSSVVDYLGAIPWEEYWEQFRKRKPDLSEAQLEWARRALAGGCVGVVTLELGKSPNLTFCWRGGKNTLGRSQAETFAQRQRDTNLCKCPLIYSVKFYNDTGRNGKTPDVSYSQDGTALMNNWDQGPKDPRSFNFDYAFHSKEHGGLMVGGDHYYNPDRDRDGKGDIFPKEPIMNEAEITTVTVDEWEDLPKDGDFNEVIWCYSCADGAYGEKPKKGNRSNRPKQ
jgi:hypothetical protein